MRSCYQIHTVIKVDSYSRSGKVRSGFSSLVLWRLVVVVASVLRGQFAWRPLYGGQLSRGQLSCTVLSGSCVILGIIMYTCCNVRVVWPQRSSVILD